MKCINRTALEIVLAFGAAIGLSIYFTYPLAFHLGNNLAELGDSRLTVYIQAWGTHTLTTHPRQLFNMNMFYPALNTMAGSENLLGNQLLFAPVYLLSGNPVAANNFVILASFFLSAMALYWLLRSVALPMWAAAVGGFIYGFALPRLGQLAHMQLLSTEWTPVVVLFLYRYLRSKRAVNLVIMTVALVLQVLCSLYLGYLLFVVLICYLAAMLCVRRDLFTPRVWRDLAFAGIGALLVLAPIALPYRVLQRANIIPQENTLTIAASASPVASYLEIVGFPHNVYSGLLRFNSVDLGWEKRLFVGFLPLLLSAIGAISLKHALTSPGAKSTPQPSPDRGISSLQEFQAPLLLGSIFTCIAAYVLSLGPVLRLNDRPTSIRLPFFFLQRWIPGMGVFRVPARFVFAFIFGIAVLAAFGIFTLLSRLRNVRMMAVCSLAAIAFISMEYSVIPLKLAHVMAPPHVAPEYRWLAAQPPGSVTVELPITGPPDRPTAAEQAGYTYASVYHWQPLINGYTAYRAPVARQTYRLARDLPAHPAVDLLAGLGLKFIVVHENDMSASDLRKWQFLPGGVRLSAKFDDGAAVYEVTDSHCRVDLFAIRYRDRTLQEATRCTSVANN